MCGICGYFSPHAPAERAALDRMTATIEHRGPDDVGAFVAGAVALGIRRLSIIDLAGGHQPIANEDGSVVLVFNGEIYNYQALRDELAARGHPLRTSSDTEVIVHLYEEMGERCVERLRGMFAFALWDRSRGRLLLARDRLGIKPLYLARLPGGGLAFASEIKALLALPEVPRELSPDALGVYLDVMYTPGRGTMFAGIERLPPACTLAIDATGAAERRYWQLRPDAAAASADLRENAIRLRAALEESVRLHMVADVPVGALLSGGVDSSIVVGMASALTGHPLKTFNVSFDVGDLSAKYDERPYARMVAQRFGTDHTEVVLTGGELARLFPKATWHLDEPLGNPTALSIYAVCQTARESVKVVLAGNGGDELFAGYLRYAYDRAVSLYQTVPGPLRRAVVRPGLEALRRAGIVKQGLAKLERTPDEHGHALWNRTMSPAWRDQILTPEWRQHTAHSRIAELYRPYFANGVGATYQDRQMYADLRTWIPDEDLMKTDKMSMMASLELRVPILDHVIADLAAGIPFGQKARLRPLSTKHILKQAFADLLPPELLSQRKQGFFTPAGKWLRTDLRATALELLAPDRLRRQGIFESEPIGRMLETHLSAAGYYGHELWTLLSFQLWYDTFLCSKAT